MSPLKKPTIRRTTKSLKSVAPLAEVPDQFPRTAPSTPTSFQLLEELRKELEKGDQLNEFRAHIAQLENEKHILEQQVRQLESRLQAQHGQASAMLDALKNTIRGQIQNLDQQLQVFSLDTSHTVEGLLAVLQSAHIPNPGDGGMHSSYTTPPAPRVEPYTPPQRPEPSIPHTMQPPQPPTPPETFFESIVPEPKVAPKRTFRRIAIRSFYAVLFLGIMGGGYLFLRPTTKIYQDGEVAGASSNSQAVAEESQSPDPYAASFAEVPFEKTEWELVNDVDFGIAVQFPTNASTKVKVIGGNNLWFVRKSTYLMRFSRNATEETLDQWWAANSATFTEQAKATKITYKGKPAYFLDSLEKTPTSGSSYILKHGENILTVWVKDEPTTTDDGKRITKMVDSLTFTN